MSNLNHPVFIKAGLINQADVLLKHITAQQVFIVTNEIVAPLYLNKIKIQVQHLQCDEFILPDGEKYKSLDSYQKIIETLIDKAHQRSTTIIALGGGVVGDIAGFVASTYQRGVSFIQIPTTLLAQVDASIGGKTALNFNDTKNMIGSFYQPKAVLIDPAVLKTLSQRVFRAGLAEVIKHALIADVSYFQWLEENIDNILVLDEQALQYMIQRSVEIKTQIVKQDEKDFGIRHVLNFGHTIGHAIEAASGYQLLHGEAVAIGMVEELKLSNDFPQVQLQRIKSLLNKAGLSENHILKNNEVSFQQSAIKKFLLRDKKYSHDQIKLPFLESIAKWKIIDLSLNELLSRIPTAK